MDWLAELTITNLGATGLLTIVILMILTDRLVTKPRLVEALKQAEYWRTAYEKERDHVDILINQANIGVRAVKSIAQEATKSGAEDVP